MFLNKKALGNLNTFCKGSITKNTSFFERIFSAKSIQELKEDLEFFQQRQIDKGYDNSPQIEAIKQLLSQKAA